MKHIYLRNLLTALLLLCSTAVVNAQTFNPWVSTNKSDNSTSETSYVFNVVSGDELTFDWKVSSEQNYDWLTITLNDEQLVRASGENSGRFSRTFTTNGQMKLLVKYTKDVSQSRGSDYGEIYNIKLTSSAAPIVGTCGDNLSWELKNGTLTISGTGDMCKMSILDYPWFEHKDNIQRVVIENGVTSIAESAFDSYYSALTSVSIANSVKYIGKYAFYGCSNLSTIDIPEGLEEMGYGSFFQTAWYTNLPENEDIYLGKVYYIRKGYNYPETLTIKEGTTCIAGGALAQCRAEEVVIPGSVKSIGYQAFTQSSMKKVTFAEGLQRIDYQAFYQCINLEEINLPTSLTTIGNYAFAGCSNITSVEIPANVTSIGFEAISGVNIETIKVATENAVYDSRNNCNAIIETATNKLVVGFKTTVIPESVTAIEQYAFDGCGGYSYYSGLQSIEIPSSVTSIGEYAFRGCDDLKQVHISDLAAWCNIKFGNAEANPLYNARNLYVNGEYATKLVIPEGVTEIKNWAFYNCTGITEVVIPASVTSIGYDAFRGCENLANVEIRGAVESIGDGAFTGTAWYNNQPDGVVYAGKVLYKYKGTMPAGTSITVKDGTLSIGSSAFSDCTGLTSIDIPASVTSIGSSAFYNCSSLVSIDIPASVTSIGGSAFYGCTGLTSIDIPASVTAIERYTFYGCTGLTNLLIPEGVTEIKESAFYNCSNIEQVVIPSSVTTIGDAAFRYCYKIKTVYNLSQLEIVKGSEDFGGVAANATTVNNYVQQANFIYKLYGDYIFWTYKRYINGSSQMHSKIEAYVGNSLDVVLPESYNGKAYDLGAAFRATKIKSIVIPESFTSIEGSAFYNCSSLASVEIPVSVTSIGSSAFYGCSSLASVEIPVSVTSIGSSAFYGCSSLANIEIPASVTSVGENAFYNTAWYNNQPDGVIYAGKVLYKYKGTMPENTSITIKDGTLSIGILAFSGCFGLVNIEIPASVKTIGGYAFENCHSLTSVVIPASVKTIGESAFSQCIKLKEIEIPGSVTSIEPYTFLDCLALTNVKIGDGVKSIPNGAFLGCEALTDIVIPNSVTSIGGEAFANCNSLKNIVIGSGVTSIEDAFILCKNVESIVIAEDNTVYDSRENCNAIIETATNTLLKGCKNTVIPDGVTSISYNAFYECAGLTSIEIPASVASIGWDAFGYCTGLTSVISRISAEDLFELDYVFSSVDKTTCTLYVPYGAKDTYAATSGWSEFTNIVELDPTEVTITINQYGCATYCSEFTLDFSNVEGLKAYAATGYKSNSKVVILTKVQTAEGGVGLFLKGEPGEYVVPIIESTDEHSLNMLVGTLEPTIVNGTEGGMTNFKFTIKSGDETPMFYQFDDNSTLSAGKAYLQIPTAWLPSTAQKSVSITFDEGETTDVDELKGDNGEQKTVYDLQGRVVENPTSGIYIIDGKKVIIK